jgi:dGTP triphosphohydrolase
MPGHPRPSSVSTIVSTAAFRRLARKTQVFIGIDGGWVTRMEHALQEAARADQERQRADQERQRADHLAELLRSAGIDPPA